jgi:small subunit ribosomal protein S2
MITQTQPEPTKTEINLKTLLESGSHFGSSKSGWHPKAAPFIYGSRNGIYIIDLDKTVKLWTETVKPGIMRAASSGNVLFVCTKPNAGDAIKSAAESCGSYYINNKWPAGLLTNFTTLRKSINKLETMEKALQQFESGEPTKTTKKEAGLMKKAIEKMTAIFSGVRSMTRLPDMVFVADPKLNLLAVEEARKLGIPVVGLLDTDINPEMLDYIIPANNDAIKTINLFSKAIAEAIIEARSDSGAMSLQQSIDDASNKERVGNDRKSRDLDPGKRPFRRDKRPNNNNRGPARDRFQDFKSKQLQPSRDVKVYTKLGTKTTK